MNRLGVILVASLTGLIPYGRPAVPEVVTISFPQTVRIGDVPTVPNGIVTAPRVLQYVPPAYTDQARSHGIEGDVTVEVEFDVSGSFSVLRVLKSLDYGLTDAALAALGNWTFAPAERNGSPVTVIARIDIPFRMDQDLYSQAENELEQSNFAGARFILQRLINSHPASGYLPQAKFSIADSFFIEGTAETLRHSQQEFKDFLLFFPAEPLSDAARARLKEVQQRLAGEGVVTAKP
jgi:TonB family protein